MLRYINIILYEYNLSDILQNLDPNSSAAFEVFKVCLFVHTS